ncbi:MAG: CHAT domain-containing protein [Kofleriaceae bacterium]
MTRTIRISIALVSAALVSATLVSATLVSAIALGGPAPKAPVKATATAAEQQQINALQKQMYELEGKGAYVPAIKVAKQLVALETKILGGDAQQVRMHEQGLAGMYSASGDYAGALAIDKQVLASAERAAGPDSRDVQTALMGVSGMLWAQNRLDEAEPYVQRALALTKQLDGEKSIMYASQLTTYAALLQMHNEYSSAERLYEQALAIQEALAKSNRDLSLLGPIQQLASIYWQTNQPAKAKALYDREIAIVSAAPGVNVQTHASTLWSIAMSYHYGGRDDLAKPLFDRSIALYQQEVARLDKDKPDDPMLPVMLGQLGYNYRQIDDLADAAKVFQRVIAIDDKARGYSAYEGVLAEIVRANGHPRQALALYDKAEQQMAKLSPLSARAYDTTIADVLRELGDYKRAEQQLLDYRAYAEKTFGKRHPMYGMVEHSLASLYMASGETAKAEQTLATSLELAEKELVNVLRTGTESDHAIYFSKNNYQLDLAVNFGLTYAPHSAVAARLGLTTLLRRKGRVLDAAAASMATIRAKLSPADKRLLDDLASARAQLAKLTVAGPAATGPDDYAKSVASLEDQIQKLEIEVGKKSAAYRATSLPIELAPIQKLLPRGAKLVELVNFQPYDPKSPYRINPILPPRRYAAYVLAGKGDPAMIDLGPASAIDGAVERFRKAVSDPRDTKVGELGNALYKLTIGKLAPALGATTNVLLAPDGTLNVVPFSALVDDHGKLLLDTFTFTYLTSGRDLLRLAIKSKPQGGGVIFADPAFDATQAAPGAAPAAKMSRGARSADLSGLMWPQLPGTGQEADEVEKTFTGLTEYRGAKATEGALKALHGPKILHLATHGFFLNDEPARASRGAAQAATAVAMGMLGQSAAPQTGAENPLLRSGLALAGANKLSSGNEDGILTSMEASGLDLWGTKLVVLSACDTGNGKVINGEGVYGLRRALVIAGAESLVMSLWQVDDLATRDLMAGYYRRLKAGEPRSTALRDVQREIAGEAKYKHPYYWAAFVAEGDNSPIR